MKVSKKTLDEAIKIGRKYQDSKLLDSYGHKFFDICKSLAKETYHIDNPFYMRTDYFWSIILTYIKCNATNETIYKAIELLGIEIE